MKYIKPFNESSSDFDINFALTKIKEEWSKEKIDGIYQEEWKNWVDDNWDDSEYDSDREWYDEHNNGEAEDIVLDNLIDWFLTKYNKTVSDVDRDELVSLLKKEYKLGE
jgi:PKD repeat protein